MSFVRTATCFMCVLCCPILVWTPGPPRPSSFGTEWCTYGGNAHWYDECRDRNTLVLSFASCFFVLYILLFDQFRFISRHFGRRRRGGCNTAGDGSPRIERRLVTPDSAAEPIFGTPADGRCDAATTAESSVVLFTRGAAPAPRATASLSSRGPTAALGGPIPTRRTAVEAAARRRAGPTGFLAPPGSLAKFRSRRAKLNGHGGYVRAPGRARQRRGCGRFGGPCWAWGGVEWLCGSPAGGAPRAISVAWGGQDPRHHERSVRIRPASGPRCCAACGGDTRGRRQPLAGF